MKNKIIILFLFSALSGCGQHNVTVENNESRPVGIVVSVESHATQVGKQILQQGGNAIDAAVAVGFVLAVTYPRAGNLGGGGFMVLRLNDGVKTTIDYREKAPAKASREMFLDTGGNHLTELSEEGYLSAGVPGSVAGMLYALEHYGTMEVSDVVSPSYQLALDGFEVDSSFAASLYDKRLSLGKYPSTLEIFFKDSLTTYQEGDIFRQDDLAKSIKRIINYGKAGFYGGLTAELFASTMNKFGGIISKDDLLSYEAIEREPIIGHYRGYEIISMPPPSSGGIVLTELLNILEGFDIPSLALFSESYIKTYIEASKYAFADRAEYLGDTDFYPVPIKALISKKYAGTIVDKINENSIRPSNEISHHSTAWLDSIENVIKNESVETTHYSIIDRWGNAVSVTTTLNSYYGSKVVVEGTGILLNNEMDDFAAKIGSPNLFGLVHGEANTIEPNKRMLSSMTPTIVEKDGDVMLITGSPGGSRIISAVAQVILNYIDFGMEPVQAVDNQRIHHQWLPDTLYFEPEALDSSQIAGLEILGYDLKVRKKIGNTPTIGRNRSSGLLVPVVDMRRGGFGAVVAD